MTMDDLNSPPTAPEAASMAARPQMQSLEDRLRGMLISSASANVPPPPPPALSPSQLLPPGFSAENLPPGFGQPPGPQPFYELQRPPSPPGFQAGPAIGPPPGVALYSGPPRPPPGLNAPGTRPPPQTQYLPPRLGHRPQNGTAARQPVEPAADHFPPLGASAAAAAKSKPAPSPLELPPQHPGPQQRRQYQPLKLSPQHAPQPQQQQQQHRFGPIRALGSHHQRPDLPPDQLERQHAEQAQLLDELARQVIAVAEPPPEEIEMKCALLRRLGQVCKAAVGPDAELVPFGSFVTGFATAASDLDLVFQNNGAPLAALHPEEAANISDTDFVTYGHNAPDRFAVPQLLTTALERAGYTVKLLTRTRVPIIKLTSPASETQPVELLCDIGFENHLAVFNTELLSCYAQFDPRVREMVIFIKWWAKRRRINSPYRGTLSSYGYVLLILHYLLNIASPPVLPNLQLFPVERDAPRELRWHDGHNIWFHRPRGPLPRSENRASLGELLRGWFDYFAYGFRWGQDVVSIRTLGGLLSKQDKGWVAAVMLPGGENAEGEAYEVKNRYLAAIEDPFETEHNVGRTCTGPGVYRIREELRRAMRFLKQRDGGRVLRSYLCQELPPEPPFVRREDREKKEDGGHAGRADADGAAAAGAVVVPGGGIGHPPLVEPVNGHVPPNPMPQSQPQPQSQSQPRRQQPQQPRVNGDAHPSLPPPTAQPAHDGVGHPGGSTGPAAAPAEAKAGGKARTPRNHRGRGRSPRVKPPPGEAAATSTVDGQAMLQQLQQSPAGKRRSLPRARPAPPNGADGEALLR